MQQASSSKLERFEGHRAYTETLLQTFYNLKQTTKDHVDAVYHLTMGRKAPPTLDSYHKILNALRWCGAPWDPKKLLNAWVYATNNSVSDSVQEFDSIELECQAARNHWGFHELKVLVAKLAQEFNEDSLLRRGKVIMQYQTTPCVSSKGRHYSLTSLGSRATIRQAWEQAQAFNPHVRILDSLRLLGCTGEVKGGLIQWLWLQYGLEEIDVLDFPWKFAHLKLVVARWIKLRGQRSPDMVKVEQDEDEEDKEDEEVSRDNLSGRHDDPTALRLFQAVTEARETASNANNNVAKAYDDLTWKSAELVVHLAKEGDHTRCPTIVPQKRRLKPSQQVAHLAKQGDHTRRPTVVPQKRRLDTGGPTVIPQKRRLEPPPASESSITGT